MAAGKLFRMRRIAKRELRDRAARDEVIAA